MDSLRLSERLEPLIADLPGRCGVCVQLLGEPPAFEHNRVERFSAASVIKLPIYYEYQRRCHQGDLSPTEEVILTPEHWVDGSGSLKEAAPGSSFSLDYLARVMLIHSDNVATNIMIERLGLEPINQSMRALGMCESALQRKMYDFQARERGLDNWITAGDAQSFFLRMLAPPDHEREVCSAVINTLKDQERNHKLPALLPPDTVVAHKTGELNGVEHDAGIIFGPFGACCVSVLTQHLEQNAAGVEFCRQVGREVYSCLKR